MKNAKQLFAMLFLSLTVISCSKDDSPEPEPVVTISDFTATIDENSKNGTSLGTLNASTDKGNITFNITSQTPSGAIAVDANTGEITIADETAFDYETNTEITAKINAVNGSATKTANVTITINDVNVVNELFKDTEIVSYHPFNGNANDQSTNNYNGTINKATLTRDRNSNQNAAYNFDGSANIDFSENIALGSDSFSISFWVKLPSNLASGSYVVFSKRAVCSTGNLIQVSYNSDNHRISAEMRSDNVVSGFNGNVTHSFGSKPPAWFHVTIVKNNSKRNSSIYINGTTSNDSTNSWTTPTNNQLLNVTNTAKLRLGVSPCVGVNGSQRFKGSIDDLLIVNRVLTDAEITELAK